MYWQKDAVSSPKEGLFGHGVEMMKFVYSPKEVINPNDTIERLGRRQPVANGIGNGFHAIGNLKFGEHIAHVKFHR